MTEERDPGGLKLDELKFGAMNNFGDTTAVGSASRRRGSSRQFLDSALKETFARDTMKGINQLTGIIVSVRSSTDPAYSRKDHLLSNMGSEETKVLEYFVYKVYIPEVECRPYPKSLNDPVLYTYPDVHPSKKIEQGEQLKLGTVVKVQYSSLWSLSDPMIVATEGDIYFAFEGLDVSKAAELWKKGPKSVIQSPASNNYPPVKSKTATNTTGPEFAKAVKAIANSDLLAAAIVAIAKQEQNYRGYNYNYYGIMADVGAGWGGAGRRHIKGSFSSTEGAAGSGVRTTKDRFFAAFDSQEEGIRFMNEKLEQKGFGSAGTPEKFALHYFDRWLSSGKVPTAAQLAAVAANHRAALRHVAEATV